MSTIASSEVREIPVEQVPVAAAPPPPVGGDPSMVGLPLFVLGSLALGLALTGYLPATAASGALPVIMFGSGLGTFVAMVWSIRLGQSVLASVFGIFSAFWLSYATLVLGVTNGWFGIPKADVAQTFSAFLLTWTLGIAMLTLVTLRLPLAFTVLFALVDLALLLVLLGNEMTSPNLGKAGGWVVLAFAALGTYLFAGAASAATGNKAYPLGKPLVG